MTSAPATPDRADANELAFAECIGIARVHEPERFIAATLAAEPERTALIAIGAFASDLARITAAANQPLLGEIRLQWWRDSLEVMAKGHSIGSPLADALGRAIRSYALPIPMLVAMCEAHAWSLYDDPMPDQASLDGYLSKTEAIPFELALRVLGVAAGDAGALSIPAGRAFGMTRLLAQLPHHLNAGRVPLPAELLVTYGLTPESLLSDVDQAALRTLISHLAGEIRGTIASLRPQFRALSRRQRVALLPLAALPPYLKTIDHRQRDPLRDVADLSPLTRVCRIAVAHALGRI